MNALLIMQQTLIQAQTMLKEQKYIYENMYKDEYNRGILLGIERIAKLIERNNKRKAAENNTNL